MTYTNQTRGHWQNQNYAKQITNFDGLVFGNLSFGDIDGQIEVDEKLVIQLELKHENVDNVPDGQQLYYERTTRALRKGGYEGAYAIIAVHNYPANCPIDAATAIVVAYYDGITDKWQEPPKEAWNVLKFVEWAFRKHNINLTKTVYMPPEEKSPSQIMFERLQVNLAKWRSNSDES